MRNLISVISLAVLTACASASDQAGGVPPAVSAAVSASVASSARPAADAARDANRKPAQVLAFAGVAPGAKVAELMPGGGYYTRLLSAVAGAGGQVYALYPPQRPNGPDPSAPIKAIASDARYANVTPMQMPAQGPALGLPGQVDVVWTTNNYHDVFNAQGEAGMIALNRRVLDALKPGGVYLVTDHSAAPGAGVTQTRSLHRIDAESVKSQVLAAGFKLAASSDALANPADSRTAPSSDPSIRGQSDQFILKFVKPAP
jgi:predicted methyltransferase